MIDSFEDQVRKYLLLINMGTEGLLKPHEIVRFVINGLKHGKTSFYRHQIGTKLLKLIEGNLALALTSNDFYTREIANEYNEWKDLL